jgi:ribonuclease P protein component
MYRKNDVGRSRFTVTLIRKYGNAVERNRAKRVSREAYRLLRPDIIDGFDMVLMLYPSEDTFLRRSVQLKQLLHKAGLFREHQ